MADKTFHKKCLCPGPLDDNESSESNDCPAAADEIFQKKCLCLGHSWLNVRNQD